MEEFKCAMCRRTFEKDTPEDIRLWVERTRAGVLSNGFYISGGTNGYGETDSRGAET